MLFWIFIICLIVGIILGVVGDMMSDGLLFTGVALTVIGVIAVIVSVAVIAENHITENSKVDGYIQRYNSLVYQYENDLYENDNDVGKRELMADIEYWNADLAYRKKLQRNFWVGIYYPNIYDGFKFIQLKNIGGGESGN